METSFVLMVGHSSDQEHQQTNEAERLSRMIIGPPSEIYPDQDKTLTTKVHWNRFRNLRVLQAPKPMIKTWMPSKIWKLE